MSTSRNFSSKKKQQHLLKKKLTVFLYKTLKCVCGVQLDNRKVHRELCLWTKKFYLLFFVKKTIRTTKKFTWLEMKEKCAALNYMHKSSTNEKGKM